MSKEAGAMKTVPLPYFSGDEKEFELYWPKFEAYPNLKGFRNDNVAE